MQNKNVSKLIYKKLILPDNTLKRFFSSKNPPLDLMTLSTSHDILSTNLLTVSRCIELPSIL